MLSGDNGILQRTTDAKQKSERATVIEDAKIEVLAKQTENKGTITEDELEEILLTFGVLSQQENILDRTLTSTKGNYEILVSEIYNGDLAPEADTGYGLYDATTGVLKKSWNKLLSENIIKVDSNGQLLSNFIIGEGNSSKEILSGKLVINDNVKTLGDYAFATCTNLTEIVIPENVTSFGTNAFAQCRSLKNINIPSGVTEIESLSFAACSSLVQLTIPENVLTINSNAFGGCVNLTVTVPNTVTSVGEMAFAGVKQVYYDGTLDTSNWRAQKIN